MSKETEKSSRYDALEQMGLRDLLENINREDQTVPLAVAEAMNQIEALADAIFHKMETGGRLFYLGAGTSGRLGIVDASECPPTFGIPHDWVVGLIAGGDEAIRKAVEFAEDDRSGGWRDLQKHGVNGSDIVVGIAASGTTPYVVGALASCRKAHITTGCIVCNRNMPLRAEADHPVEVIVGPEFVTGSTRMKAGTAQKLVLNMLTTSTMIRLGRVKGNKMVDMQLSNDKLVERGTYMVMHATRLPEELARERLLAAGSVRAAIKKFENDTAKNR